jgi:hypothetical protein
LCGCDATSSPAGEADHDAGPLPELCDGSDEIRLGFSAGGGFQGQDDRFLSPLAYWYLFVRGDCSYVVSKAPSGEVRSGALDEARASELADELGFAHISAWSSFHDSESCPDAGAVSLHAVGKRVSCTCGCGPSAPDGLEQTLMAGGDAMMDLWEHGDPLTGPVTAAAYAPFHDIALWPSDLQPQDWTLPWDIERIVVPDQTMLGDGQLIEESDGAPALRELRAHAAASSTNFVQSFPVRTSDGMVRALLIRDELPTAWSGLPELLR